MFKQLILLRQALEALLLRTYEKILENAQTGAGGNIQINAFSHVISSGTHIDASSEQGLNGSVSIATPEVDATSGLAKLSESYLDVSDLLKSLCSFHTANHQSRFVVTPRDGMIPSPDAMLSSRVFDIDTQVMILSLWKQNIWQRQIYIKEIAMDYSPRSYIQLFFAAS